MTQSKDNKQGFTLVELMLSMSFVAMLLLAIAFLIIQVSSIYNKGLTLRAVNEAGALISSDIQRTLNTAVPLDSTLVGDESGGRLCVGSTVYAWNYAETITNDSATAFNIDEENNRDIRFSKFTATADTRYCELPSIPGATSYPSIPEKDARNELLEEGDLDLVLHPHPRFNIKPDSTDETVLGNAVAGDPDQRIYHITLTIGTNEVAQIDSNGCTVPNRVDDEYCAVNVFEFTARAGNKSKDESNE